MPKRRFGIGSTKTKASRHSRGHAARAGDQRSGADCELLERRRLLSTVTWTNRNTFSGTNDNRFDDVFGTLQNQAMGVIDAALTIWGRVIDRFNYSNGTNTFNVTVTMNATAMGNGAGGVGANAFGGTTIGTNPAKPASSQVAIGWRSGITPTANSAAGWFLDPTPLDNSEFGTIVNGFTGSPTIATNGVDMLTAVMHELGHAMGLSSNTVMNAFATDTGVTDTINTPASSPASTYWRFDSSNAHLLFTEWDSGGASPNPQQFNGTQHYAPAGASVTQAGRTYSGATSLMNAVLTGNRSLLDDGLVQALHDAYGYSVNLPSFYGTFYDRLDNDGTLTIRPPGGNVNHTLDLSVVNSQLIVTMSVGAPVAGIDPNSIQSAFDVSRVNKIVIDMGDGNDSVTIQPQVSAVPISLTMGNGTADAVTIIGYSGYDALQIDNPLTGAGRRVRAQNLDISNLIGCETLNFWTNGGGVDAYMPNVTGIGAININSNASAENITLQSLGAGSLVTVNAGSGNFNNVFTLANTLLSVVGSDLIINGNGGTDRLVLDASLNTAGKVFNVFDGEVTTNEGTQRNIDYTNIRNLDIYTGSGGDFVQVYSMGLNTAFRYFGGNGNDVLYLGYDDGFDGGTSWTADLPGSITFFGEGGTNDSLTVDERSLAGGATTVSYTLTNGLLAGPNAHNLNFDSLCENFGFFGRSFGNTVFTVLNYNPTQHLFLHGGLNSPSADFLNIDDRTMSGPPSNPASVEIYPNQIKRIFSYIPSTPHLIDYDNWTSPSYYGNTANSNVIKLYGVSSQVPAGYQYTVFGGTQPDTVTLYPHDSAGNLTMNANLGIVGDAGYDTITFDDTAGTTGINYLFNNPFGGGQTNVSGMGLRGMAYGNDFEDATIKGGSGNDSVRIDSYLGTTRLTVFAGNGGDSIDYSPTAKNLATTIRNRNVIGFDGQGGADRSTIWNDNNTSPWFYQDVSGSVLVDRTDALPSTDPNHISYQLTALNTETTVARGGSAADSFGVNAPASLPFYVVGNGGLDSLSVVTGLALFDASDDLASINLNSGAFAAILPNGGRVLSVKQLFIGTNAALDLNDNDLIIDYDGASQLANIQAKINAARNGGAWDSPGITSSSAHNANPHNKTLGVMEATQYKSIYPAATTFDGLPIDNTAVLVKFTYYGDADFNGVVNFDDYSRTDAGFNQHKSGWLNGDFDGNGTVNFDDYSLIDLAFNTQGSALRPGGGSNGSLVSGR